MSARRDSDSKINLSLARVLLLDASEHGLEILSQIVKGFGAHDVHRCSTAAEADRVLSTVTVDLILIDPELKDDDGFAFLRRLRSSGPEQNRHAPIVLMSGHAQSANVARARDSGANFVVVKPASPKVLLDRILWIIRDRRQFVSVEGGYCGPDRRFKFMGPPPGSEGRRAGDLKAPIGDASEPNMSQLEINDFIKPQKVAL